jgi:hypothetical protein
VIYQFTTDIYNHLLYGINLRSNFSELDKRIISELADILDSPNKEWEKLADSLDLLLSMQSVLDKQESPTTYLLSNMDVSNRTKPNFAVFNFLLINYFFEIGDLRMSRCKVIKYHSLYLF